MLNTVSRTLVLVLGFMLITPAIDANAAKRSRPKGAHCKAKKMSAANPRLCACGAEDVPRVNGKCPKQPRNTKAKSPDEKKAMAAKLKADAGKKKQQAQKHRGQSQKVKGKKAAKPAKKADMRSFYQATVSFASAGSNDTPRVLLAQEEGGSEVPDQVLDNIAATENQLADIDDGIATLEEEAAKILEKDGDADHLLAEIEELGEEAAELGEILSDLYAELDDAELSADDEAMDEDDGSDWED